MASRTYGILWRWHFLAGLAACPVLALLALTGALYVFQPELERMLYAETREVEPRGERRSLDELARSLPPECAPDSLEVPMRPTDPLRQWCPGDGKRSVFVDPYTGEVLGDERWDDTVFGFVLKLHWELAAGETGRIVVEWTTSIALVLLVSGAYLWWPARRGGGRWWPRRGVPARQRLRDLHAIGGAYALPVVLVIAATGLFWTRFAGEQRWHRIADDPADRVWDAPPRSSAPAGRARIGYDRAIAGAGIDLRTEPRGVSIWIGAAPDAAYAVYASPSDQGAPWTTEVIFVDAYDASILQRVGWAGRSVPSQLNSAGYALHVGAIAGMPGRIAALVGSLVVAALCVTGPWMWWKRRPRGQLGVPPRPSRFAWPLVAAIAALGWVLPTLGYTLLGIAAFELGWLGMRRVLGRQ